MSTVERIRQRFVEGGMERALNKQPRPKRDSELDERSRAVLVAAACSKPPAGNIPQSRVCSNMGAKPAFDKLSCRRLRSALRADILPLDVNAPAKPAFRQL